MEPEGPKNDVQGRPTTCSRRGGEVNYMCDFVCLMFEGLLVQNVGILGPLSKTCAIMVCDSFLRPVLESKYLRFLADVGHFPLTFWNTVNNNETFKKKIKSA